MKRRGGGGPGGFLRFAGVAVRSARTLYVVPRWEKARSKSTVSVCCDKHVFTSVAAAVEAARPGDTVMVMPGEYREVEDIREARCWLCDYSPTETGAIRSVDPPHQTTGGWWHRYRYADGAEHLAECIAGPIRVAP